MRFLIAAAASYLWLEGYKGVAVAVAIVRAFLFALKVQLANLWRMRP